MAVRRGRQDETGIIGDERPGYVACRGRLVWDTVDTLCSWSTGYLRYGMGDRV